MKLPENIKLGYSTDSHEEARTQSFLLRGTHLTMGAGEESFLAVDVIVQSSSGQVCSLDF